MRPLPHLLAALLALLPLSAAAAEPVRVVASFSILADMVAQIGGDDVAVTALVPAGGDAHVYQPSPGDVAAIAAADLVVLNGLGFEGWLPRLIAASGYTGPVVEAAATVEPLPLSASGATGDHDHDHDHDHAPAGAAVDPHAWQSLANGALYVGVLTEALATVDPARADDYRRRGQAYAAELLALHADTQARFAALPAAARTAVTTHQAFGYFAAAYGLTLLAPLGISTESDASAADLAALLEQIETTGARALFVETLADRRLIDRIAAETGGRLGGALYSDSLSPPDGPASTYLALFRYNVDTILAALGGS